MNIRDFRKSSKLTICNKPHIFPLYPSLVAGAKIACFQDIYPLLVSDKRVVLVVSGVR
jgi:hypothetical protein